MADDVPEFDPTQGLNTPPPAGFAELANLDVPLPAGLSEVAGLAHLDVPLPAGLAELVQSMQDIEMIDVGTLTRVPDIEMVQFTPAPEVSILQEIRDLQTIQGGAIATMAEGIKLLSLQAQREDRRTWALIGLTVVIAVLTAALLVATVAA